MKKFIIFYILFLLALNVFAVEVSDYSELRDAVNQSNGVIQLTQDIVFGNRPLVITTNTALSSISGSTFTIQGNSTSPMFIFNGADSSISNVNFSDSSSGQAPVIIDIGESIIEEYSTFSIDGVTFSNNVSSGSTNGGALYIETLQGTYIHNTNFVNNASMNNSGGALSFTGKKGFVGEEINAYGNVAQQNGGAIYASTITLIGSTLSSNTAVTGRGGAIYVSSGTIQNSAFYNNSSSSYGGAIYASTLTVVGSVFSSNTSSEKGGAIYIWNDAYIQNTSFSYNTANLGGALVNQRDDSTVQILQSVFENNQASSGGAIMNDGDMVISGTQFNNNISNNEAGAILNYGTMEINNSSFSNNISSKNGGAIFSKDRSYLIINSSNFTGNISSQDGGAIYFVNGSILTLNNSAIFTNNTAGGNGGAIYASDAAINFNLNGNTVTFKDNRDSSGDNDIYLDGSSTININGGGGTINFYGGVKGGKITSDNANINWYTTNAYDGTLSLTGGSLNIIAQNAATFNRVSLEDATLSIQNGVIDSFSPSSLNINGDIPLYIDVDLANATVDTVTNVNGTGGRDFFSINSNSQLNVWGDRPGTTYFYVTDGIMYVNARELFSGSVYMYRIAGSLHGFSLIQTDIVNPVILALPVAANSKAIANINTVSNLYNRIDAMISRKYLDYYNDTGYLQNNTDIRITEEEMPRVTGKTLKDEWQKMTWFIPNIGYQKVNLGKEVGEVKNTFYGGLIGIDYPFWFSDTSAFIPTVFAGYLGSRQKYQKTTLNNDSLAVGGMLTYVENFAMLSALAYITNGPEKYNVNTSSGDFDIFSFTASVKGELSLDLTDYIVMQPALTVIYNLSNLQNYTTANLAHMQSTRFHNFLLTPSVKFMASCKGWYPYVGLSYNLSNKQKGSIMANDFAINSYKLKNFGEISAGLESALLEDYSGYAQVSAYTGSSKGVSFEMGVRGYLN